MDNNKILEKIKQLSKELPKEIGVYYGKKIKDNKYTGKNCFVFIVTKKRNFREFR